MVMIQRSCRGKVFQDVPWGACTGPAQHWVTDKRRKTGTKDFTVFFNCGACLFWTMGLQLGLKGIYMKRAWARFEQKGPIK